MTFNYDNFINSIYEGFKDDFTMNEIRELLKEVDKYDKDTPISTGKRLILTQLSVKGKKSNGDEINFTLPFKNGVNLIIADNFKGKSSIFKMIQLALTGNNKIKNDVKKWIHLINLCFKINDKNYSSIIKFNKSRMNGSLYSKFINAEDYTDLEKVDPIFEASGYDDFEKKIQDFFFKQFSYYSLKWTQKASQKDKNELTESKASWKTYFKSIYLESKDSSQLMYGAQSKKVLQMLLGLELTNVINELSVKCDMLTFNKAKQSDFNHERMIEDEILIGELEKRNCEIEEELAKNKKPGRLNELYEIYEKIINEIQHENLLVVENGDLANEKATDLNSIKSKILTYTNEMNRIEREITKTERYINDLTEYIEVGIFFSNLDIKHCPSCNHEVANNRNRNDKKCLLCHEDIGYFENEVNKQVYHQKINDLKSANLQLKKEKNIIKTNIEQLKEKYEEVEQEFITYDLASKNDGVILNLKNDLKNIENKISEAKINVNDEIITELNKEKAVIEYRLSTLKLGTYPNNGMENKIEKQIDVVKEAVKKLSKIRYENSKKILNYLSDIMLQELHHFGLKSISEINISESFDVYYRQDGDNVKFDEIAEGEQLRAKIAFYLALIQLDIEYNFGRHTRFLIIDSPNKEEGDSNYLEGLTETLKNIDNRYGENLQIIIGTAERGLEDIVKNQEVFEKGVYIF
ncbi:AAA family ATPase [Schinkia azotoformans]|uniref:hypothetical protein n=1 Tax=Schinkia azotoformans TaxID=1454 RepID=UPI002E23416D|nr:AAA family ATPase [Schinkia azotoformans]